MEPGEPDTLNGHGKRRPQGDEAWRMIPLFIVRMRRRLKWMIVGAVPGAAAGAWAMAHAIGHGCPWPWSG